jgi:UDP-2,3-diacylglucosamine hydrolase
MDKRIIFFSDVHLAQGESQKVKKFSRFLSVQKGRAEEIYILGDLFDFWVGPRQALLSDFAPVLGILKELAESGIEITFLAGNRDFYLGKFLKRKYGIRFLEEAQEFQVAGKRIFLTHGDLLCTGDKNYRRLRRVVRNRAIERLFTSLPLQISFALAQGLRRHSRRVVRMKPEKERALVKEEVRKIFQGGVQIIISGHTHRPAKTTYMLDKKEKFLYTLGDWEKGGSYLEVERGRFKLRSLKG